jgi:hypothetical protein
MNGAREARASDLLFLMGGLSLDLWSQEISHDVQLRVTQNRRNQCLKRSLS